MDNDKIKRTIGELIVDGFTLNYLSLEPTKEEQTKVMRSQPFVSLLIGAIILDIVSVATIFFDVAITGGTSPWVIFASPLSLATLVCFITGIMAFILMMVFMERWRKRFLTSTVKPPLISRILFYEALLAIFRSTVGIPIFYAIALFIFTQECHYYAGGCVL